MHKMVDGIVTDGRSGLEPTRPKFINIYIIKIIKSLQSIQCFFCFSSPFIGYCLIGDNGRLQYLRFCLFDMYVNVVFVIRRLYSAVNLSLFREQRFIRIIIIGLCALLSP